MQFVENEIMLASVNFYRDSTLNFKELKILENRTELLKLNPLFEKNTFLTSFLSEDFPIIEEVIQENIIEVSMSLIKEKEGDETADLVKLFLIDYAIVIAKASKEDWLAFIAIKDSVSDSEEKFINRLKALFFNIS